MGLRISIDLDDRDLKHFRLIMREARRAAVALRPEEIVESAESLLDRLDAQVIPRFVSERLSRLRGMIRMLTDHDWRLPKKDTTRVLNALAYFAEPEDLIPDHVPGLGYLDDAIMIELVVRELRHEIDAYEDFCEFRRNEPPRRGIKARRAPISREEWLEKRRRQLQDRMRRRRARDGDKKLL
jgi:uncharacterized membrane protein YkvA (DUF1232 family)